ncbi:Rpn family recombination-promoting nuclease/putative transposase [Holdemania massiliensis]|uniref:Rpn family recombination-promoting nuclease/putative transposase n=1 Tax=Holdemania massiliensis TaxID=1468449 RepID=UPI001F052CDA|nr:Rpn family recombination-promoting nuclease/putative transposase [Holdemania massiliensis]MCH1941922.1 Rpn family recombination-promoting nuclease/putative transposase [Holdemania massiliensis]
MAEISNYPHKQVPKQDSVSPHQRLRILDYRENDVFRYTFGSEEESSRRIRIAYLSDLLQCRLIRADMKNTEPMKDHSNEKGIRFDLLLETEDDEGRIQLVNLEIQNYQMSDSLSLRSQGYLARIVSDQITIGDQYDFDPVVQVMITNRIPQIKESYEDYLHPHRFFHEIHVERMAEEQCRILWVEMDKLENLEKKPIEEWRISEKIHYMIRFSHAKKKQKIIQELIEKEEIIAMMEEKKRDFLRDTSLAIARMRAKFDELDEQRVYEKGIMKGQLEGQRTLIQLVLGQRMKLSEADAKQIDSLESEALEDFILQLDKIQTPEDLQRQIAAVNQKKQTDQMISVLTAHD